MNLLEQLKVKGFAEREQAGTAYRAILARADNPQPRDAEQVEQLLKVLSRDVNQLAADQALAAEIGALERDAGEGEKLGAALIAVKEQRKSHAEDFERRRLALLEEHSAASSRIEADYQTALRAWQDADQAAHRLSQLREQWGAIVSGKPVERHTRRDDLQQAAGG